MLRIVPLFSHLQQYERDKSLTGEIKQKRRTRADTRPDAVVPALSHRPPCAPGFGDDTDAAPRLAQCLSIQRLSSSG